TVPDLGQRNAYGLERGYFVRLIGTGQLAGRGWPRPGVLVVAIGRKATRRKGSRYRPARELGCKLERQQDAGRCEESCWAGRRMHWRSTHAVRHSRVCAARVKGTSTPLRLGRHTIGRRQSMGKELQSDYFAAPQAGDFAAASEPFALFAAW